MKRAAKALIFAGIALITLSLGVLMYMQLADRQAEKSAEALLQRLDALLPPLHPGSQESYRVMTMPALEVDGRDVTLTLKEYEVLKMLLENQDVVLTRDRLLNQVWGYAFDGESRTVDVHIRTLRQKLGPAGELIETIRGVGYKIGGRR